ncbi:MAG: beta-glucosidase [Cyanobacteria bacterium Co-bin13]|nr:beta-glucosidase [Cyanobacteria bacterium Co-bin13]
MASTLSSSILPPVESLSLAEQVAQMVVVRTSGHLFDHEIRYPAWEADQEQLRHYLQDLGVGGVILLGGSAAEVGVRSQTLQSLAAIPLLIAADIEEGVGQRFSGATWFPPPMALEAIAQQDWLRALDLAEQFGAVTAQEALAIGINWVLAPVVDVNNNPANPVINVRAFGQSPSQVSGLTSAFIRGAKRQSVLTAAKHFPGHGDTAVDSHLALPIIPHDRQRLEQIEFEPFRAAIAAGVDTVVTAHLQVPALDAQYPATLSHATLTETLRQDLGFDGLIVTDALIMGAITQTYGPYEAAVLAVEAGADVLLMPVDPEGAINAVCEAVAVGRISEERISASVERLWRAKQKATSLLGLPPESCHAWEHLPPPPVQLDLLAQPSFRSVAAAILHESATVQGQLDLSRPNSSNEVQGDNIIIVDDGLNCPFLGRTASAIALPQQYGYRLKLIDTQGCCRLPDPALLQPSLLQVFIRGNPFRGSASLTEVAAAWLQALLGADCLQGLVIYGSPYAFEQFRADLPEGVPYAFTYGQMPEAQTQILSALLGLTIQGLAARDEDFTD